ncbi:MAG: HIT domain-containing protein [Algiphilus sp.]|jgi:diadenosine tetraphosphate (Ap4A) HIT family hydrolase
MADFVLDSQLQQDCFWVSDFPLCRLLMMNDARFRWFLLVPRVPGARDAIDLSTYDYRRLWTESADLCRAMRIAFTPHKLNVAALGNQVAQLHIHHIARYQGDATWPRPVWGNGDPEPMDDHTSRRHSKELESALPTRLRSR